VLHAIEVSLDSFAAIINLANLVALSRKWADWRSIAAELFVVATAKTMTLVDFVAAIYFAGAKVAYKCHSHFIFP
jgi:hypothetical protein